MTRDPYNLELAVLMADTMPMGLVAVDLAQAGVLEGKGSRTLGTEPPEAREVACERRLLVESDQAGEYEQDHPNSS